MIEELEKEALKWVFGTILDYQIPKSDLYTGYRRGRFKKSKNNKPIRYI